MNFLSKTQINMWQRCPFAYYCRYVEGLKIPPTGAMFIGRCFDDAINYNYNHKIEKGKDEKVTAVQDYFNDTFKAGKDEVQFEKEEKPEDMKDTGIKTTGVFHKDICKKVKPKDVQVKDSITFENVSYSIQVVVDLITTDEIVIDNKYTGRTWAQQKELGELDPVIYSLWYQQKFKKRPACFRFDIGIGTKTPKTEQRELVISENHTNGFLRFVAVLWDNLQYNMERGIFLPRTDHFLCSRRKCGYWQKCEKQWGHRIKE